MHKDSHFFERITDLEVNVPECDHIKAQKHTLAYQDDMLGRIAADWIHN